MCRKPTPKEVRWIALKFPGNLKKYLPKKVDCILSYRYNSLSGIKREIYEFLNDFLPGGQAIQIADMSSKHPWKLVLYSSIQEMLSAPRKYLVCYSKLLILIIFGYIYLLDGHLG